MIFMDYACVCGVRESSSVISMWHGDNRNVCPADRTMVAAGLGPVRTGLRFPCEDSLGWNVPQTGTRHYGNWRMGSTRTSRSQFRGGISVSGVDARGAPPEGCALSTSFA